MYLLLIAVLLAGMTGCSRRTVQGRVGHSPTNENSWLMRAKNYASTRYSTLHQINASNVAKLGVAWTFSTGVRKGHEAAPLVLNDTVYIVTPYPNTLYALDGATGSLKWAYAAKPDLAAQGVACCDVVNRGAAYAEGRIFFNSLDNHTIAVDADTGKEIWKVKLGDINKGESMTMAPLAVKGKVYVGNSGGEFGVRGWLTALNAADGRIVWRAYSTGPDKDVLIGPEFKPFYEQDRGKDLGVSTWPKDGWKTGGGTVWGWISYDPDLNLIYYGTAHRPEDRPPHRQRREEDRHGQGGERHLSGRARREGLAAVRLVDVRVCCTSRTTICA